MTVQIAIAMEAANNNFKSFGDPELPPTPPKYILSPQVFVQTLWKDWSQRERAAISR